ncbi:MAG TPA: hypothetical protein VKI44_31800 [Acetobacteraceae bacterium]|nr:hypothetical protein [Acetobacteraceae bacterium]
MVRRDITFGGLEAPLVPILRLAEQRSDVLLEHGERRICEPRLHVRDLRDQDCGAARRLEIDDVLHRHDGSFREQPTQPGGMDSPGT